MAKWSEVWTNRGIAVSERQEVINNLRQEGPHLAKKRPGGKYPHLQPFFKNRPKERLAA